VDVTRAISTVVDAALAIVLVSAAAVALVTIPEGDQRPPDPDAAAKTVLASTADATFQAAGGQQRTVTGRTGTLLAHAAVAEHAGTDERFVRAVANATGAVLAATDRPVEVVASAGQATVRVGQRPPPSASVAAVSHEITVENGTATVTVRTWSP
jgi:hypothetical protein